MPLALLMMALATPPGPALLALGFALEACGLGLRLWGVAHIGPGSRRRSAEVGRLALTGPYRHLRNPLYLGNLLCWAGLACWTGRLLCLPLALGPLLLHYTLIVRWEERRLAAELGAPYEAWRERVPRWLPTPVPVGPPGPGDWRTALRSERSTHLVSLLLAVAILGAGVATGAGLWATRR